METKREYRFWNGKGWSEWYVFPFYLQRTFEENGVKFERRDIEGV